MSVSSLSKVNDAPSIDWTVHSVTLCEGLCAHCAGRIERYPGFLGSPGA